MHASGNVPIELLPAADGADLANGEQLDRGEAAREAGRLNEADGIALDVLARTPGLPHALALRAKVAAGRQDLERATFLLEAATAKRADPTWLILLSNLYRRRFRLDDALGVIGAAVAGTTGALRLDALIELARVLIDRDDQAGAASAFLAALAIDPEHPGAHLGLGQILLGRGEFAPGWIEYEWRNKLPEARGRTPAIKAAAWNGMALPQGRLLVICDQGFGDSIQFARLIPQAASRVHELVLACSPELEALFGRIEGVARCCPRWADIPGFSAHVLLSSLPGLLGVRADTIPAALAYLELDPVRVAAWRDRLAARGNGRRIGLFWAGRPTHPNNARRSLDLDRLLPVLAAARKDQVVSLQKDRTAADLAVLASHSVLDVADELTTFDETASLIANLDLVVTVDSAVAHLGGAIGRPVWVLLASPADWRWQLHRERSAWYPSVRLFRQPAPGDWASAIASLAAQLSP